MIYCVEDDDSIRELMIYALNASGFSARGFSAAAPFRKALAEELPELILLDIMLPDEDGISILKSLKAAPATQDIPVIMATAKGNEYDKVIGLDLGADDYLAKPFGMMEMISRIKAVLRRVRPKENSPVLHTAGIRMDTEGHRVSVDGKEIELTLKEYELLKLFLQNPGRVFTRDALLSAVWDTDYEGETRTVDVHIGTLRTKLGRCGDRIRTVRGVGYRMEADA